MNRNFLLNALGGLQTRLSQQYSGQPELLQKAVILTWLGLMAMVFSYLYFVVYGLMEMPILSALSFYAGSSVFILYYIVFGMKRLIFGIHFYCFTSTVYFTGCAWVSGGIYSPFIPWLGTAPILCAMLLPPRDTLAWSLIGLGLMALLLGAVHWAPTPEYEVLPGNETLVRTCAFGTYFFFLPAMLLIYDTVRKDMERILRLREVEGEMEKSQLADNLRGRERERKRVAREFHDHLGTLITVVRLRHEAAQEKWSLPNETAFFQQLEAIGEKVSQVSHKNSLHLLRDFGLAEALENIAYEFRQETGKGFELMTSELADPHAGGSGSAPEPQGAVQIQRDPKPPGPQHVQEAQEFEAHFYRIVQLVADMAARRREADFVSVQFLALEGLTRLLVEVRGQGLSTALREDDRWTAEFGEVVDRTRVMEGELLHETFDYSGLTLIIDLNRS